jgi:hypothetical protein
VAHKVKVAPVRLASWNDALAVNHLRLIGFRAVCECGWKGKVKRKRDDAHNSAWGHAHHPQP